MNANYQTEALMRFPIGYAEDNQNPTEEHTDQAVLEAFKTPAPQYVHNRIWLPHRDSRGTEIVEKLWKFYTEYTTTALATRPSKNSIFNCGHVAIFMLVPEDDKTIAEAKKMKYDVLPKEIFEDGIFRGDLALDTHTEIAKFGRYYANWNYSAADRYSRHLHNQGYDVGHLSCGILSPNNFNKLLGEYLPEGPVHPMITVFAGTKASAMRHTGMRDKYTTKDIAGKSYMNSPWDKTQDKSNYFGKTVLKDKYPDVAHGLVKWNADKSDVTPLTDEELLELNYIKYDQKWHDAPKQESLLTGGKFTY